MCQARANVGAVLKSQTAATVLITIQLTECIDKQDLSG